jgi:hypothetical protein
MSGLLTRASVEVRGGWAETRQKSHAVPLGGAYGVLVDGTRDGTTE